MTTQVPEQPITVGVFHRTIHNIRVEAGHAWPVIEHVVTDQALDELLEAALTAAGQGVAAIAFEAATDALRGAMRRAAQSAAASVDAGAQQQVVA